MKPTNNMRKKETNELDLEQKQKEKKETMPPILFLAPHPIIIFIVFFIDFAIAKRHPNNINLLLPFSMGNKFLLT